MKLFEKCPPGKYTTIFLRRDGICEPLYASRPFHGESFLDVPTVGLIHDLGKGSVYRWGDKNIRFVLENVSHTPDPRYANFTSWLYEQGFDNMGNIREAFSPDGGRVAKEYIDRIEEDKVVVPVDKLVDEILEGNINGSDKPGKVKRKIKFSRSRRDN